MVKGIMKENRYTYETSVKKQIEESDVEIKEDQGQKLEIKRTVKKVKPIKIALLKPDRKLYKSAEMFYAKALSDYLKVGLMPYSLVAKRYANDGGPLTDQERTRIKNLQDEARKLEAEFFTYPVDKVSDEDKQKKNELLVRINKINEEINNIQNVYSDIFDNTAEVKARNDTMEWWVLFLAYIDEDGQGYKPLFKEGTYEDRIAELDKIEEKEDPFYVEVIRKLSYLNSFWFTARNTITKIDFETMEKLYMETLSDYKVVEDQTPKEQISEPVVEPPKELPREVPTITPTS